MKMTEKVVRKIKISDADTESYKIEFSISYGVYHIEL